MHKKVVKFPLDQEFLQLLFFLWLGLKFIKLNVILNFWSFIHNRFYN